MIPLLTLFGLAILTMCALIAVKPSKKSWMIVGICVFIIFAVLTICCLGFTTVTKDSHAIASITIGNAKHDMFYDSAKDEYFYVDGHNWRIIYPQHRVILDYETAKVYAEQYAKLKEFDFATVVEGKNKNGD